MQLVQQLEASEAYYTNKYKHRIDKEVAHREQVRETCGHHRDIRVPVCS